MWQKINQNKKKTENESYILAIISSIIAPLQQLLSLPQNKTSGVTVYYFSNEDSIYFMLKIEDRLPLLGDVSGVTLYIVCHRHPN